MSERHISEMSIEELNLYRQQLTQKLTEVDLYLRNKLSAQRFPPPSDKDDEDEE